VLGPHLFSPAAVERLRAGRYTCVLWSSLPHDWDDPEGWVDTALADCERMTHPVVVLHDLPTGAMASLPAYLDALEERGVEVVQDFPTDVIPIADGRVGDLDGLVRT
jgi:hypothetical protein